ncbi:hypothetical protein CRUP_004114 [Coryphaenoides rupestris]|nr:hypothetical protein CRUP_004114 [Coryphaenoides rupestris]
MVLQKSPERAVVWGYGPEGEQVNVTLWGPEGPQSTPPPVTVTQGERDPQVFNSEEELNLTAQYPNVRVFMAESVEQFSGLCWIYGRLMYATLKHPIGLVQSCESNSFVNTEVYNCSFPAMIDDWRSSFHEGSGGQTAIDFPFGFLSTSIAMFPGYKSYSMANIRWHQTANTGFAPNPRMNATFMAVAMDLGDDTSPYHPIHPRDKYTVAYRLSLGARAVAYGEKGVHFLGPYPKAITSNDNALSVNITYDQAITVVGTSGEGFEICCADVEAPCSSYSPWIPVPVVDRSSTSLQVSTAECPSTRKAAALRYAWKDLPCDYKDCLVYSAAGNLPAPPFTIQL